METTNADDGDRSLRSDIDPAADLALLHQTQSRVVTQYHLDAGPWWYAPLVATCIAGVSLFGQEFSSSWHQLAGVVGLAAGAMVGWHDHWRRRLRIRPSTRSALIVMPLVLGTFVMMALWGTAISTLGVDRFVPGYAVIAWFLTTAVLLGAGAAMNRRRGKAASS